MKNKLFVLCLVAILTITLLGSSSTAQTSSTNDLFKSVESLTMFQAAKFNAHYRAPNTDQIETLLEQEGIPLPNPEARALAVQVFRQMWAERNPTTPNPDKLQKLLETVIEKKASDLHVTTGSPPVFRIDGKIVSFDTTVLTAPDLT